MDFTENSTSMPEENDLAAIYMWLQPFSCFGEVELKVIPGDSGSVYVWDNQNKTGKVLPKDGEPSPERWKIQWGVPASVKIEYIEGRWPAQQTSLAWNYVINDDDYVKFGTETYTPVVLEVDIDIAGVKDDHYVWPGVTEETTPGVRIPLGDKVQINRLKIRPENEDLVPVNMSHSVLLYPKSGGSKIRLVDGQDNVLSLPQFYTSRSELDAAVANGLYVEGMETSSSVGDVTLALRWHDYEDEIKITVYTIESIKFQSSKMSPEWKTVDEWYKFLGVFTNDVVKFVVNTDPSGVLVSDGDLTWGGSASGSTREVTVTFNTEGTQTVNVYSGSGTPISVNIEVKDQPSGPDEIEYCADHVSETAIAYSHNLVGTPSTLEPWIWAQNTFPGEQRNTKADAARHAYWACLLTRYCGSDYALGLTTAHEVSSPGPHTETVMDLHNNSEGAGCIHYHFATLDCCRDEIVGLVNAGSLWYLDEHYGEADSDEDALLQPTNR